MKKIAIGNIKEHIRTHEAVKSYEDLRSEVLTMAMFIKVEKQQTYTSAGSNGLQCNCG